MAADYDAIIIGGGHNGLVTAAYLGRAGRRVLVLERRHLVGGAAVTEEVHPGFKFTVCSYVCSLLRPEIIRDLDLPAHGYQIIPVESTLTPLADGRYLFRGADSEENRKEISKFSKGDAEAYTKFGQLMVKIARFLKPQIGMTPPNLTSMNPGNLRRLWELRGRFKEVDEETLYTFAKLMTMSSGDYLDEWFETDALKGTMCASGIIGTFLGPRSPGTAYVLIHHYMGEVDGAFRAWGFVRGGMGGVSDSIAEAARSYGVEIRTNAETTRILVEDGKAVGVELASGERVRARVLASGVDPKRTFLRLVERSSLPQDFVRGIENYNTEGSSAKVNLALREAPNFTCLPGEGAHLQGAISISPSVDYIERAYDDAKYGSFSRRPYLDVMVPSAIDPTLAPPGKHVVSMFVQYAPYSRRGGWDDDAREALGDTVIETLSEYAPNVPGAILHRQVLTPMDLEREIGLTGGNIFHGELTPNQLFFLRPLPGWAQYRTPIRNLYLCGSGTHPGGGVMGAPGYNAAREILKDWSLGGIR
ncbi:MAG TPA: NAD(P)/FAD-dependent oxidoreductase [Thermoplasmata archaeon]|jgi:phytoene dehydrogenase-like protein